MKELFGMKIIQNTLNLINHMEKKHPGKNIKVYLESIVITEQKNTTQHEEHQQLDDYTKNAPKCPECDSPLMIRPIKQKNKLNYKSEWYCVAGECVYEKYSTNDLSTELKNNGIVPKRIRR